MRTAALAKSQSNTSIDSSQSTRSESKGRSSKEFKPPGRGFASNLASSIRSLRKQFDSNESDPGSSASPKGVRRASSLESIGSSAVSQLGLDRTADSMSVAAIRRALNTLPANGVQNDKAPADSGKKWTNENKEMKNRLEVSIGLSIHSIHAVNHDEESFRASFRLTMAWKVRTPAQMVTLIRNPDASVFPKWLYENGVELDVFDPTYQYDPVQLKVQREVKVTGRFYRSFDLRDFPFDEQELQIRILPIQQMQDFAFMTDPMLTSELTSDRIWSQEWDFVPGTFHVEWDEEENALTATFTVRRICDFFVWNVFVMLGCMVTGCFFVQRVPRDDLSGRLQIVSGTLLAVLTDRLAMVNGAPRIAYLTTLDVYYHACFGTLGLMLVHCYVSNACSLSCANALDALGFGILFSGWTSFHLVFGKDMDLKKFPFVFSTEDSPSMSLSTKKSFPLSMGGTGSVGLGILAAGLLTASGGLWLLLRHLRGDQSGPSASSTALAKPTAGVGVTLGEVWSLWLADANERLQDALSEIEFGKSGSSPVALRLGAGIAGLVALSVGGVTAATVRLLFWRIPKI